jgi:2-(1,2-epoxy-1,2-dihydrophenyl)acetyl-CoA isomerase
MILFTKENQIATITLNRPDKYNSFNRELALAVQEALDDCQQDAEIRAVYLTGAGKAFSAGQDLQEVIDPNGPELKTILVEHFNPIISKIRELDKPVVCGVNGVAAGAGANIALACDITIATESATFIQAFSKIGLIPDSGGTFFLPRLIGLQRATALMMLGEKVTAKEAEAMGMIYKAVPDIKFQTEARNIVEQLAQMPTKALGLIKRALNNSLANDLDKQLAIEDHLQSVAGSTEDYKEGVQAFLEKRKANFTGQ